LTQEFFHRSGDLVHGGIESQAVRLGGLAETTDFANKLQGGCGDFLAGCGFRGTAENLNAAAHFSSDYQK
jgi:hypothetical protein